MEKLVNSTNRVHGYSWDASDIAFFSGSASNLTSFLRDYARIEGIEAHRLILHEGVGEAKSLSVTNSRPCDWKLFGCPKRWLDWAALTSTQRTNSNEALQRQAAEIMKHSGYDLEIHFWTGGHIALDEVSVPKNVTVTKAQ
jgi:hypothetical protein